MSEVNVENIENGAVPPPAPKKARVNGNLRVQELMSEEEVEEMQANYTQAIENTDGFELRAKAEEDSLRMLSPAALNELNMNRQITVDPNQAIPDAYYGNLLGDVEEQPANGFDPMCFFNALRQLKNVRSIIKLLPIMYKDAVCNYEKRNELL